MSEMNEQLYRQVSDSIKLVFDLTSRMDERVKMLVGQHNKVNQKIEKLMERQENHLTRVSVLEAAKEDNNLKEDVQEMEKNIKEIAKKQHELITKISALEINNTSHDNKWKLLGDFIFKLCMTVIAAIIAWRLGISQH